jgi:hypothetical protein
VAVAPESMKQDLIDDENFESVPKTMKAKVQLLLKKLSRVVPLEVWDVVADRLVSPIPGVSLK